MAWVAGHRTRLLRSANRPTGDRAEAEDLVQEAVIKVAERLGRLRAGHPTAYARRVIVHDHASWWRRRRETPSADPVRDRSTPGDRPCRAQRPAHGARGTAPTAAGSHRPALLRRPHRARDRRGARSDGGHDRARRTTPYVACAHTRTARPRRPRGRGDHSMTRDLHHLLERETAHLESSRGPERRLEPGAAPPQAPDRSRDGFRRGVLSLWSVVTWRGPAGRFVARPSPSPTPTPSVPTSPGTDRRSGTSSSATRCCRAYDPADWESLPSTRATWAVGLTRLPSPAGR